MRNAGKIRRLRAKLVTRPLFRGIPSAYFGLFMIIPGTVLIGWGALTSPGNHVENFFEAVGSWAILLAIFGYYAAQAAIGIEVQGFLGDTRFGSGQLLNVYGEAEYLKFRDLYMGVPMFGVPRRARMELLLCCQEATLFWLSQKAQGTENSLDCCIRIQQLYTRACQLANRLRSTCRAV